MKKWRQLLFVVLSVLLLAACGIQSVEQHERMEEAERSIEAVVSEPLQEDTTKEAPVEEQKAVPTEQTKEEVQLTKAEVKEEVKPEPKVEVNEQEAKVAPKSEPQVETKPAPKPEPQSEAKVAPKSGSQEETKVAPEPAKPVEQPKEEVKPAPKKRTVTIAIYVHSLVANMDKLHPSLKSDKYVPASGVVLAPVTYELLSEKDTVWDILRRAAKEHKIHLEYEGADENIYDSVYLEGIHHLYEFSAGPLSGWMYKVNGTFPSYGASQYTLEDGDVIEWHYTVDLGRDLGKEV